MIITLIYGLCFLVLASRKEVGARAMAGLCLAYLICENIILYTFNSIQFFDLTLYFTICWTLDSILLFVAGMIVRGLRQTLMLVLALPLLLAQVFVIQYPALFPDWLYVFAIQEAHKYFIEVFIFIYSWRDNTVPEWLRTGTVLTLVVSAHLIG